MINVYDGEKTTLYFIEFVMSSIENLHDSRYVFFFK